MTSAKFLSLCVLDMELEIKSLSEAVDLVSIPALSILGYFLGSATETEKGTFSQL
jgi:hypothetical protein